MRHTTNIAVAVFLAVFFKISSVLAAVEAPKQAIPPAGQTAQAPDASANQFPSGLLEISDYKYPVFLYAPAGYSPSGSYPLIIVAPSRGAKAEEGIKYLKSIADRKTIFVLSPHGLWAESGDVPYMLDEWLLKVKEDVVHRFPIDEKKVFIAGKESGANYAAYFALKYADKLAGAALIGGAWDGPFSQLMIPQSSAAMQLPFFVALRADQPEIKTKNESWFNKLQEKGYPLRLVEVKSAEDFQSLEFKKEMCDWLEEASQSWSATVAQSQKSFKSKLKKGVKEFFTV